MASYPKFKAAAVQAAPVFMDRAKTVAKACRLIEEAADNGANLMVFPEVFIPAYPYWGEPGRGWVYAWRELLQNSIEIPSPDTDALGDAARRARAYVAVGLNERDRDSQGTIYNSLLFLGKEGQILGVHRKLVPYGVERLYWGVGDGSGLLVFDTEYGRLGGLICAEHFMPLSKYALYGKGEQIHCAVWPGNAWLQSVIDVTSREYALESQAWVIVSSCYLTEGMIPDEFRFKKGTDWEVTGGSGIISPRSGQYIAGPVYDKEAIIYGEIDMGEVPLAKAGLDTAGHFARRDVASLVLDEEPRPAYRPMRRAAPLPPEYYELREALRELVAKIRQHPSRELLAAAEEIMARVEEVAGS